ncbi:MAG: hypothetical protein JRD94_12825, partial [Deltaproteobacteria bacterium]|nr:hypothetical protein [Deltaproteobacteria bacterium]
DVRVLVSGTSSFLEDAFMPPPTQQGDIQMNAALALALNSIDWLAADSDLIAIRAKTVEEPALDIPDSVLAAENTARAAAEEGDQEGVNSALGERRAAIASWDAKKRAYRWCSVCSGGDNARTRRRPSNSKQGEDSQCNGERTVLPSEEWRFSRCSA